MENKYRKTKTTVSMINYHFVFCPRYRRKIFLIEGVEKHFKELVNTISEEMNLKVIVLECDIDHVHLFINAKPTISPSKIMYHLKRIMRPTLYQRLFEIYNNVEETYGYITKQSRMENNLSKEHRVDARCITRNPLSAPSEDWYYYKKVRCQNRQIHKSNHIKGHRKKMNQAPFEVKGFRLFDKVEYNSELYYIFGRRMTGFFSIRKLNGSNVNKGSLSCKKLKLRGFRKTLLIERRYDNSSTNLKV